MAGTASLAICASSATGASASRRRVALLLPETRAADPIGPTRKSWAALFAEFGWVDDDKDFTIEVVRSPEDPPTLEARAKALVDSRPSLIITSRAIHTLKKLTSDIPIVMYAVPHPDLTGVVRSLARPGGNITGVGNTFLEVLTKRMQVLKDAGARSRIVDVFEAWRPYVELLQDASSKAAAKAGLDRVEIVVEPFADVDEVAARIVRAAPDGVMVAWPMLLNMEPEKHTRLLRSINAARLRSMHVFVASVRAGGLLSYGRVGEQRLAVEMAARILRGADPAAMPVQTSREFQMTVNLRTAREIGITLPDSIMLLATEVIR